MDDCKIHIRCSKSLAACLRHGYLSSGTRIQTQSRTASIQPPPVCPSSLGIKVAPISPVTKNHELQRCLPQPARTKLTETEWLKERATKERSASIVQDHLTCPKRTSKSTADSEDSPNDIGTTAHAAGGARRRGVSLDVQTYPGDTSRMLRVTKR